MEQTGEERDRKVGVDLLWVRVGQNGGTESFIRNLLDGFARYDDKNEYLLFVSEDNADSFRHYEECPHMSLVLCNVKSASRPRRILWENLHLDREAARHRVDIMFIPVYSMPRTGRSGIPYVCVIHDLQALHYPEYFSRVRREFLRYTWKKACAKAQLVLTDSDYCREDLIQHYPNVQAKTRTMYVPVTSSEAAISKETVQQRFNITPGQYYYCVSSMLPHKNLDTILRVMAALKKEHSVPDFPLVISGVGGREDDVRESIARYDIEDRVVLTGFVTDEERDGLYENCALFLFPSIFEGFGMPPIEAMRMGRNVVMTDKSCLGEITQGKAFYVKNPTDVREWIERMGQAFETVPGRELFLEYAPETIARQYMALWEEI